MPMNFFDEKILNEACVNCIDKIHAAIGEFKDIKKLFEDFNKELIHYFNDPDKVADTLSQFMQHLIAQGPGMMAQGQNNAYLRNLISALLNHPLCNHYKNWMEAEPSGDTVLMSLCYLNEEKLFKKHIDDMSLVCFGNTKPNFKRYISYRNQEDYTALSILNTCGFVNLLKNFISVAAHAYYGDRNFSNFLWDLDKNNISSLATAATNVYESKQDEDRADSNRNIQIVHLLLEYASRIFSPEEMKQFLLSIDKEKNSTLTLAVGLNNAGVVSALLAFAARTYQISTLPGKKRFKDEFLEHQDASGATALNLACRLHFEAIAKNLMSYHASLHIPDSEGLCAKDYIPSEWKDEEKKPTTLMPGISPQFASVYPIPRNRNNKPLLVKPLVLAPASSWVNAPQSIFTIPRAVPSETTAGTKRKTFKG